MNDSTDRERLINTDVKSSRRSKTKSYVPFVVVCFLFLLLVGCLYLNNYFWRIELYRKEYQRNNADLHGAVHWHQFLVETPYCRIPKMNEVDASIEMFINPPPKIVCNNGIPPLFEANHISVSIIPRSLKYYNISDLAKLKCCYKAFWRIEPNYIEEDKQFKFSKDCHEINRIAFIEDEFIEVSCSYSTKHIYKDFFAFIPLKKSLPKVNTASLPKLNVLMMGLDAVSRLNLHRQMPKTVAYLKQIGSVELLGYNKVADNTFPNLMPVLAGLSEKELTKVCYPSPRHRFDNCEFIWNKYKRKGYVTAFGETASWMGLFHLDRNGFKKPPTDYAYNYFNMKAEKEIANSHPIVVNQCVGGRLIFRDFLQYINQFLDTMNNNSLPYFSFFWEVNLSHDDVNYVSRGDEDYFQFFRRLHELGYLQNTALVFMSDHGIRIGKIRKTYQGSLEERLPFVFLTLPDWFKSQYREAYQNLIRNTKMLTSPFDLHETLVDMSDLVGMENRKSVEGPSKSRGISFFQRISNDRSCADAGIVDHWCACLRSENVNKSSAAVSEVADFVVSYINSLLEAHDKCARLSLDSILDARLLMHSHAIVKAVDVINHILIIRTVPGQAEFEATVRYDKRTRVFSVIGTISRLTLYKDQSSCISDAHLKLYCFCNDVSWTQSIISSNV